MWKQLFAVAATIGIIAPAPAFETDRAALTPVSWTFDLVYQDVVDGDWTYTITDDGDVVTMGGETNWVSQNTTETDVVTLSSQDLVPIALAVRGDFAGTGFIADVYWEGAHATGAISLHPVDGSEPNVIPVDTMALRTRLNTFGALRAAALEPGQEESLEWFNTHEAGPETVRLSVGEPETITVPAGVFEVYPVTLSGPNLVNVLYFTTDTPRDLVRVDVDQIGMRFELRAVEPFSN